MHSGPITIDGIAGPVAVTSNSFTGKHSVTVGGQPATRTGRRTFALPTSAGGTVEGKVRSTMTNPFPTVEVAGVKHRTGPEVPVGLQILVIAPFALIVVGALVGGLIGAGGVVANWYVVRGTQTTLVKALLMVGVFVVALVVWLIVAAALVNAVEPT